MTLSFHFLSGPGPIFYFVAAVGLIVDGAQTILNRPIATPLLRGAVAPGAGDTAAYWTVSLAV